MSNFERWRKVREEETFFNSLSFYFNQQQTVKHLKKNNHDNNLRNKEIENGTCQLVAPIEAKNMKRRLVTIQF